MGLPGTAALKEFAAIAERAEGLAATMREVPYLGRVLNLPGGAYVRGSVALRQVPHWVAVSPFAVPETAVTEALYRTIMGRAGLERAPPENPVTSVSWNGADAFFKGWMGRHGAGIPGEVFTFPWHAESELALRGPAVDRNWMMERMEGERIPRTWDGFRQFVQDRIENVVTRLAGEIITDLTGEEMRVLFDSGAEFSAWRVFGTDEGNIQPGVNAWVGQKAPTRANWGPPNGWRTPAEEGPLGMAGGVFEWLGDLSGGYPTGGIHVNPRGPNPGMSWTHRVLGGGGSWFDVPVFARAARRFYFHPDGANGYFGLRGVLRPQDPQG